MQTPNPWVLVCGGFHRLGGMDRANYALAKKLLEQGRKVHLVCHEVDPGLASHPCVMLHRVSRPLNSILLGERALRRSGIRVASEVTRHSPEARVVVNGGNCDWPDINWVHSVHACWPRFDQRAPWWFRTKSAINKWKARADERVAFNKAKLLIANSERTRHDLLSLGVPEQRIRTVYLGSDPEWQPASAEEKRRARSIFQIPESAKVISFVGALGYDRNKGFDTLLAAFESLLFPDIYILAAGGGRGLNYWRQLIRNSKVSDRVRMIGFTDHVADVYAASDLLVSPVRYEAFGLNVMEAICRGVPAIVSSTAGVAELYPEHLRAFQLPNSEDRRKLAGLIREWYSDSHKMRELFEPFSARLRNRTLSAMAEEIIGLSESGGSRSTSFSNSI